MAVEGTLRPGGGAAQLALNMKLLGHHELAGFGGVGEGNEVMMIRVRAATSAHERAARPPALVSALIAAGATS